VTTTSQPTSYSTTSSDTITISSLDTIDLNSITTIDTNSISTSYPSYTYSSNYVGSISISSTIPTLTTAQISTLNNISIDTSSFKINLPEEWVDTFPDFNRVQKMCEEYPGLKIALEKFKTVYKLVKDHYDTPEDKRPRP